MDRNDVSLLIDRTDGQERVTVSVTRLIVAGWAGRDKDAVAKHIEEFKSLGVPPPTRTPTYMNLSPGIVSTAGLMEVVGPDSSGEVECVVFKTRGRMLIGVGSDHTDRNFEKYGIPASKQMCDKIIAPVVWEYPEVKDHMDRIVLRSWMTKAGDTRLYQEGGLDLNLDIGELMEGMPEDEGFSPDDFCMFCGTFPAIGGIVCGERFGVEMEDPVLGRTIRHSYGIRVLPQHL